jgi:type VI secretion system protein ImpL
MDIVLQRIERVARRKPSPLNDWLTMLTSQSYALVGRRVGRDLDAKWTAKVLPFCRRALMGRYPLDRNSQKEVTLEDFARFFGPGGLMAQFFEQHLSQFVDTSRRPWRVRGTGGVNLKVSRSALRSFQQAEVIRETFFAGGGNQPSVRFWLKPIRMDAAISSFVLDIEGQGVSYRHGPPRNKSLQWPGPEGIQQVRIQLSPPTAGSRSGWTQEGPWAWFRLLDKAEIVPTTSPEVFHINFDLDGRVVTYQLRASSAFNPFRLKELEQFRCPENL